MSEVTHTLSILGMSCGGCSGRVTKALTETPGVISATISHATNSGVVVTTDELSTEDVMKVVTRTGYDVSSQATV